MRRQRLPWPMKLPSRWTNTLALGSAVPLKEGELSLVIWSPAAPLPTLIVVMAVVGPAVSTVTMKLPEDATGAASEVGLRTRCACGRQTGGDRPRSSLARRTANCNPPCAPVEVLWTDHHNASATLGSPANHRGVDFCTMCFVSHEHAMPSFANAEALIERLPRDIDANLLPAANDSEFDGGVALLNEWMKVLADELSCVRHLDSSP
jgi:hypothetical protein